MTAKRVMPEDRKRSAPMTAKQWTDLLSKVHAHIVHCATEGTYEGSMTALIDEFLIARQLGSSASAVMVRLQAGGWLTYDDKEGGFPTWVVQSNPVTIDDVTRADWLTRKAAKRRNANAPPRNRKPAEEAPMPTIATPPRDPHTSCRNQIDALRRQITEHVCQPPADAVSRETYDKDMGEMHDRLDDAETLVRALMADPKTADLIRKAVKVTRDMGGTS